MIGAATAETLEHYMRLALHTRENGSKAAALAMANVHAPVQRALSELGVVTVRTDEDIADVSCVYEVDGPGHEDALVFVSTVLPYAAVILRRERRYLRFASERELGWPGSVVSCLTRIGLFVLPEEVCRAKRTDPRWPGGPTPSYFEDLFEDEFGPPEDWTWITDAGQAQAEP